MSKIERTSENQRRCVLNGDNGCESCQEKMCPYIYCQKVDCMDCTLRLGCPMCQGTCEECIYHTGCVTYTLGS